MYQFQGIWWGTQGIWDWPILLGDIPQKELDKAFKAARQAFSSSHKISTWPDTKPTAPRVNNEDKEDELEIDIPDDDDMEKFIDDDD